MKKSQILAALALAFALGVVAPVASTYATIIGTEPEVTNASKAITDTITKAYNAGGTVDLDGTKTLVYSLYNDVITEVAKAETAVKAAEDGAATALKAVLTDADAEDATKLNEKVSVTSLRNATYAQVVTFIRSYISNDLTATVMKGQAATATDDEKDASTAAAEDIAILNNALAAQKTIVEEAYATQAGKVLDELQDLTDVDAITTKDGKYDLTAYNKVIAAAKALPKYDQYKTLIEKVAAAFALKEGTAPATVADADKAVAAIEAAIVALTGVVNNPDEPGTDEPGTEEPGSKDPSAPGTGLVSTAEGNAATTVSIVAGLATALTALGAGVVAYRSARRSNK